MSKTDHFNYANHTTTYACDDYRRVKSVITPDRGDGAGAHTTSFYYDANGTGDDYRYTDSNVTWIVIPSGKKTNTHYDDNRRKDYVIVGAGLSDAAKTSYNYDNVGNLTKVTAPEQQTGGQFQNTSPTQTDYDERDRPYRITDALNNITQITYDAFGRKKTVTRPNTQMTTNNSFDQMNRVTQQTATGVGSTNYTYWPGSGLLHTMQDPHLVNGEQYEYIYDSMGRKQWVKYPHDSGNPPVQTVENFGYDNTGCLHTYFNRNGKTQTFAYDGLNRMVSFSWNDGITPYTLFHYDGASRQTYINNGNATITKQYFDDGLLKSETEDATPVGGSSKTVSYNYDADGNRAGVTYPENSYTFTYLYTGRNQIGWIYNGNTSLGKYGYNRDGDMTGRQVPANGANISSYNPSSLIG